MLLVLARGSPKSARCLGRGLGRGLRVGQRTRARRPPSVTGGRWGIGARPAKWAGVCWGGLLRLPGCWHGAQPPRRGVAAGVGMVPRAACSSGAAGQARAQDGGASAACWQVPESDARTDARPEARGPTGCEYRLGSTRMAGVYSAAKKKEWEKIEVRCPLEAVSSRLWSVASRPPGAWSVDR